MGQPSAASVALATVRAAAASVATLPVLLLNGLTSRRGYSTAADVPYGDRPRQRLDVYTPDSAGPDSPVVVFFHGGGWESGSKSMYVFVGQALASGGAIVVLADYRLYPEAVFPAFVEDAAQAVAWTSRHLAGKDGLRRPLFIAGHSAGAQIAALLALDRHYLRQAGLGADAVAGAIGLSGPYDFLPLTRERYKAVFPEAVRPASQPIAFVDGTAPPMLLLAGDADRTVRPGNTTRLAAEIRRRGGAVSEIVYAGVGHLGTVGGLARVLPIPKPPVRRDMLAFIGKVAGRKRG